MTCCHTGSDPKPAGPENFYTIQVAADYATDQSDNWVMASDKNGVWLDAQPFEAGQTVILHGVIPQERTFTLHFFSKTQVHSNTYYSTQSFTTVPVLDTWTLKGVPNNPQLTFLGDATIILTNFPNTPLNNTYGVAVSTLRGESGYTGSGYGSTSTFTVPLYDASTDVMISFFGIDGAAIYVKAVGITPGGTANIDVAVVGKTMDAKFNFDYTSDDFFEAYFYGYPAVTDFTSQGIVLSQFFEVKSSGNVSLGYTLGFDHYKTLIMQEKGTTQQVYNKIGTPITKAPTFAAINVLVNDASPSDFSATPNFQYDLSSINLSHLKEPLFNWTVYQSKSATGGNVTFAAKAFPAAMIQLFPVLDVAQLKVSSIVGTDYLDGYTYSDFINQRKNSLGSSATEYLDQSQSF